MKLELHISSHRGLVPGATHYRGRIVGEYPPSCHGGIRYHDGKKTCVEGHELARRIEWDVEAPWSEARYQRWAAQQFEGAGPQQYADEAELVRDAIGRFLGMLPCRWWEGQVSPAAPGDELYLGHVALHAEHASPDGWGHRIAIREGRP